eukprot:4187461-Amphidinium_carterae.1
MWLKKATVAVCAVVGRGPDVADVLTACIQSLYNSGVPISHGTWTLAGVQYMFAPVVKRMTG